MPYQWSAFMNFMMVLHKDLLPSQFVFLMVIKKRPAYLIQISLILFSFYIRKEPQNDKNAKDFSFTDTNHIEKVYEINSEDFQPLYYITYNYKYSVNGEPYDNGLPEGFTLQADSFTLPYFTAYGYKLDYSLGNNTYKCTWYEDPELTIPAHDASFGESVGNKQLYAKWELHGVRSITVFKEGEQTPIKVEFTFPYNVTTQKIDKEVGKKEGFLNVYFFDKECKNNVNNLVLDEENIDLYLKQIEIEHKISTNIKLEFQVYLNMSLV